MSHESTATHAQSWWRWSGAVVGVVVLAVAGPVHGQLTPGEVLVIDTNAGTGFDGGLFVVNPSSGVRTLLSDFGVASVGGEPLGVTPLVWRWCR